jgi:hypothetical protein
MNRIRFSATLTAVFGAAVAAAAWAKVPAKTYSLDSAPPAWAPAIEKAQTSIGALQQRLFVRLTEAMNDGGPVRALDVCKEEAQRLTVEVAKQEGIAIGRTSFRVRNGKNAPRPWAKGPVMAASGKKVSEVDPVLFDLGTKIGLLRPIPTGPLCLNCHGDKATLAKDVRASLERHYPTDRATGFKENDVRGFFWAEVSKP